MELEQVIEFLRKPYGAAAGVVGVLVLGYVVQLYACTTDNKSDLKRFALSNDDSEIVEEAPPEVAPPAEAPPAEATAVETPTPQAPVAEVPATTAPANTPAVAETPAVAPPATTVPVNPAPTTAPPAVATTPAPAPQGPPPTGLAYSQSAPAVIITVTKPEMPLPREQARGQSLANLERIAEALRTHAEVMKTYPAMASAGVDGKPLLSWRVHLLPQLGLDNLYKQFRLTEPWDSDYNRQLIAQIPPVYMSPERFDEKTNYLAIAGRSGAFFGTSPRSPLEFEDGGDSTLVVVEVDDAAAVPWTKPDDYSPPLSVPRQSLGHLREDGVFAILANHLVMRVPPAVSDLDLAAMMTVDGGEAIDPATLLLAATAEPDPATSIALVRPEMPAGTAATPPAGVAATTNPPPASAAGSGAPSAGMQGSGASATGPLPQATVEAIEAAIAGAPVDAANELKMAVPDEQLLKLARDQLRELYRREYEAAKRPEDKQALLNKLVEDSQRLVDDPPAYYETLRICLTMATSLGDAPTALRVLDLLEAKFRFESLEWRLMAIEGLTKSVRSDASVDALYQESQRMLGQSLAADDYDAALTAYDTLLAMVRRRGNRTEANFITQQLRAQIDATKQAYTQVPDALKKLQTEPANPLACETVGTYFCLLKNRWDVGLPLMARGENVKQRVVATIDLETEKSPKTIIQLGDQYFDMGGDAPAVYRLGYHMRAIYYYRQALPQLTSGLDRLRIEKRLAEMTNYYGAAIIDRIVAGMNPTAAAADPVAVQDDS